jgi:cell division protein FtsL
MKRNIIITILILSLVLSFICVSCGSPSISDEDVAKEILRLQKELEEKNSEIENLKEQVEELEQQSKATEEKLEETEELEHSEAEVATEESTELYGTRKAPAGIGDIFEVKRDDWLSGLTTIEIEMTEVVSGEEAWNLVKSGNQFNDEPPEGKEYILAKFKITVLDAEEEPFELNHAYFSAISGEGIEYTDFVSVSGLEPDLSADIYIGATHEGWTYYLVNIDDDPLTVFDRKYDSEIWFKLRQ